MTFLIIDIKFYFVQASSYSYLVQKLGLRKFKHLIMYNLLQVLGIK